MITSECSNFGAIPYHTNETSTLDYLWIGKHQALGLCNDHSEDLMSAVRALFLSCHVKKNFTV